LQKAVGLVVILGLVLANASTVLASSLSLTGTQPIPRFELSDALLMAQSESVDDDDDDDDMFMQATVDPALEAESARYAKRYKMLRWHQGFALASLGLITIQTVLGQILYSKQYASFGRPILNVDEPRIRLMHQVASYTSFSTYSTAMILALTAPGGEDGKSSGCNAMCWHKALPWIHGTGMMVMPWLGLATAKIRNDGPDPTRDRILSTAHLGVGYATVSALIGAYLVILID